ncbi:MAG: hypothetical protein AB1476_00895 [Candidatus Hadarchaeota archaeon]
MRKSLLLWLLPVVDVFAIGRILAEYRSLGVEVPWEHAKAGLVERWAGYLPSGLIIGWFAGFWQSFLIVLGLFAVVGPIEFYLMCRGVKPWRFFRGKNRKSIAKIFLLEGYNTISYYLLGAALAALVLSF